MRITRSFPPVFGIAACAAVSVCLLTDLNDGLFLFLGLGLSAASNLLNILSVRLNNYKEAEI